MSQASDAVKAIIANSVRDVALNSSNPLTTLEAGPVAKAITDKVMPSVLHATNNEPWYQSRVTWGAIGAIALPLLGFAGVTSDIISPDEFVLGGMALGSAVSGFLTLWGRWKARKPIGTANR